MTHYTLHWQDEMMIKSFAVDWPFGIFNIFKRESFSPLLVQYIFLGLILLLKKLRNSYFQELSIFHCAQIVNHLRLMLKVKRIEMMIKFFSSALRRRIYCCFTVGAQNLYNSLNRDGSCEEERKTVKYLQISNGWFHTISNPKIFFSIFFLYLVEISISRSASDF